jgi:hypothetical protein
MMMAWLERQLFVAIDALAPLVALLGFDAQGRDRPRIEALQADRLAGLLAIAVGAFVEAGKGGVDLGNQLALAVTGAKLERPLGLRACPVGDIGVLRRFVLQVLERLFGRAEDLLPPAKQLAPEIGALALVHERLIVGGPIVFGDFTLRPHESLCQTHGLYSSGQRPRRLPCRSESNRGPRRSAPYLRKRGTKSSEQTLLTNVLERRQPIHVGGIESERDYRRMTGH